MEQIANLSAVKGLGVQVSHMTLCQVVRVVKESVLKTDCRKAYGFKSYTWRYSPIKETNKQNIHNERRVITIIKISKQEAKYLLSKGLKFGTNGFDEAIHASFSKCRTYYLTESKSNLELLNDYRASQVSQTIEK